MRTATTSPRRGPCSSRSSPWSSELSVVTGIALFFLYRPTAQAWGDLFTEGLPWDVRSAHGLRLLHRLASWAAVPTVVATAVVLALGQRM